MSLYSVIKRVFKSGEPDEEEAKAEKIGRVESLESFLLVESGMRGSEEYEITMEGERAVVRRYRIRYLGSDTERIPDGQGSVDSAAALEKLNSFRLGSWNGFHGPHPRFVRDGIMFRLEAQVNGGRTLRADGSENFPSGYTELKSWIYAILRNNEND